MSDPAVPAPTRPGPLDPNVAVGMLQRGQLLAEQGDWTVAAATFGRVVGNNDPVLHVAALLGLAESRYRMDDEPAAIQAWISATQAPETPLTWRAWKALAGSRVRSGDNAGAARAYREADRRAPASEKAEIASRLGWLSKEMGDQGAAQRHFRRSRTDVRDGPVVTYAIIAITVGIAISSEFLGQGDLWARWLQLDRQAVLNGEYWRLLSVVLVHAGIIHLAFNMYALYIIGPTVESLYGSWRFLFLYLACGAAGSTASFVFSDAAFSVGASGAIFGLFGVLLVADRVHKPALTRGARNLTMQIGVLIAVNLVIGLTTPTIDNAAHVGGLLAGCWLGLVMVPRGATTLRSFWTGAPKPGAPNVLLAGQPVAGPGTPGPGTFDASRLWQLLGVGVLLAVIAAGVAVGPVGGFGIG